MVENVICWWTYASDSVEGVGEVFVWLGTGHLMLASIFHHGTVSKADTWFLAKSELDSFSKWVKMSDFGGHRTLTGWKRGGYFYQIFGMRAKKFRQSGFQLCR